MKLLIFSPHPDDDCLGCGGTIAKNIQVGNDVSIVYMTLGEAGSPKFGMDELGEIRRQEAIAAGNILGVRDLIFLEHPDGCIKNNLTHRKEIKKLFFEIRPDKIFLPHTGDTHKDHIGTTNLVTDALLGLPTDYLFYEIWPPLQKFTFVEDISSFIDIKLEALRRHKTQLDTTKFDEAVRSLNRYRGVMTAKGEYCECFG